MLSDNHLFSRCCRTHNVAAWSERRHVAALHPLGDTCSAEVVDGHQCIVGDFHGAHTALLGRHCDAVHVDVVAVVGIAFQSHANYVAAEGI